MKDLNPKTIIFCVAIFLMFLFVLRLLWKEWRDGRRPTTDDLLYDLNFKIENSMMDDPSELYLINLIKEYRLRSDIDREKLDVLETKFRRKFSPLHEKEEAGKWLGE